jgi:hypothetical protein
VTTARQPHLFRYQVTPALQDHPALQVAPSLAARFHSGLAAFDDEGRPFVEPGEFRISVGGGQPGAAAGGAIHARLIVS